MNGDGKKIRLLIIDEELPYPLDSGKKIRTYNLIKHLSREMDIHYLAFGDDSPETQSKLEAMRSIGVNCRIVNARIQSKSGPIFAWKLFANLFSRYPYIVTSHYKKEFIDQLRALADEVKPDIILAEWTPYARYFDSLATAKKAIVAHNIESTIWRRYYQTAGNPAKKLYILIQALKIEAFERKSWSSVDGVIVVSQAEKLSIQKISKGAIVELVDNGVDTDYFKSSEEKIEEGSVVFTGSMDWRPNQDAVEYFVNEIFPILKLKAPEAKIYIVGRKAPKFIKRLESEHVIITGTVDDVRPYLGRASVVVVPLRIGGGSRLKILEAMAMKKPVVSTSVGAEGLEISIGENIAVADNPADFADACFRVMSDSRYSSYIAENGFSLVNERYRWDILAEKMKNALTDFSRIK